MLMIFWPISIMYEALEPSYQLLEHGLFSHTCTCTHPVADKHKTKVGLEFVKKRGEYVEFHVIPWWNHVKFHGGITLDEKTRRWNHAMEFHTEFHGQHRAKRIVHRPRGTERNPSLRQRHDDSNCKVLHLTWQSRSMVLWANVLKGTRLSCVWIVHLTLSRIQAVAPRINVIDPWQGAPAPFQLWFVQPLAFVSSSPTRLPSLTPHYYHTGIEAICLCRLTQIR